MPRWSEFERRQVPAEASPQTNDTFEDVCARVFTSGDGRELLKHLYAQYIDRSCRPLASEAELREAEAKRALIRDLETRRDAGIQRAAQAKKS